MDSTEHGQENRSITKTSAEKRKLTYRELLNKIEDIQAIDECGLNTAKQIGDILKEANDLQGECSIDSRVQHADETLLDSMVLSSTSKILVKCIESVDVFTVTYEPSEFLEKIKRHINQEESEETNQMNWIYLLDDARSVIPAIPNYRYVYGTYDLDKLPEPVQKKKQRTDPKEKLQRKEPERVRVLEKEEQSIDEIIKLMCNVLTDEYTKNGDRPISYYEYVIDTDSFSNTVENMFYFSFLVRDGKALFDLDNKGAPYIKPMRKSELKAMRDRGECNGQIIVNISMDEWEKFKKPGFIQVYKK